MNAVLEAVQHDRSSFLGGSDAAAILGVSPWKSAFQLYQEKTHEFHEEVTPEKQRIFNRGKRWEPIVIEMLVDELEDRGHDVKIVSKNNRYIDNEHPFLAAEIDLELMLDGEHVNGEMKTVHPFAAKDWGEEGTDEIPIYYTAQVAHGQMITGRNKTIVAALIGADDLRVHEVSRDDELIHLMRGKEIEFWQRILDRNAPDPTSLEDIKRLYQIDSGKSLEADAELLTLYAELSNLKADYKAIETTIETLTTRIKARMGEAALIMHNGKKLVSWKTNKSSVKTDWKEAFYELVGESVGLGTADIDLIIEKHTATKPGARPFSVK